MKKLAILLVCLTIMVGLFIGCTDKPNKENENKNPTPKGNDTLIEQIAAEIKGLFD